MDPWKIGTFALGAGWALTAIATAWIASDLASVRAELRETRDQLDKAELQATAQRARPPRPGVQRALGDAGRFRDRAARDQAPADDDAEAPLPPQILDRARQQIREEWRDRAERRVELAREAFEQFVDDEGLSPELVDQALDLWDAHRGKLDDLRQRAVSGDVDRGALRDDFRAAREELQSGLVEIFGEDGAERLRATMPNPGMAGPGPFGPGLRGPMGRGSGL